MSQIEELKNKADIVQIISEYLPLKRTGRNYKALCPFHQEKTPSFIVSPQLQIFKCFGCGEGGDVIKFVQLYERLEFWEAAETVAQKVGFKLQRRGFSSKDELLKKKIYTINHQAAEFYHFLLTKHPIGKVALTYLSQRGINQESIKAFQLGFAPPHPQTIVKYLIQKKRHQLKDVLTAGLATYSAYHSNKLIDRFRSRIVFPIWDHRGNIVGFSGRIVPSLVKNPDQIAKYINTPETLVYHKSRILYGLWITKEEIKKENQAVVVEGDLDLVSCWQVGIKNVVALKGTAFTPEQAQLIKRFADKVILALDEDAAGSEATIRGVEIAEKEELEVRVATLGGKFKDPDEAAQKDPEFLKNRIKKAESIWQFVIKLAVRKHGKEDAEAVKKITQDVLPFLARIENSVVQAFYLKKLAEEIGIEEEVLSIEMEKLKTESRFSASTQNLSSVPTPTTPLNRQEILEQYLLELIFASPNPKKFLKPQIQKLIKTFRWQKIFSLATKFSQKQKFSPKKFLSFLPEELKESFEKIFLAQPNWRNELQKEIEKTTKQLKILHLRELLGQLSTQIAQEEKNRDFKELRKLERKFSRLTQKLVELEEEG